MNAVTLEILCTSVDKGGLNDLTLLRTSGVRVHPLTLLRADGGYQGYALQHKKVVLPHKKPRKDLLTPEQRAENQERARARLVVEHVIRRLKVFRILKEVYRHRRKRFALRISLLAGLYNLDLARQS